MTAPAFFSLLFGLREGVPNIADRDSVTSVRIAEDMLRGLDQVWVTAPSNAGPLLEEGVAASLAADLRAESSDRAWVVERKRVISDFAQYFHLAQLDAVIKQDDTGVLSVEVGRDYMIKPDVTVGYPLQAAAPLHLHAAVSCKWTIRSDRVQGVRYEGAMLARHRRGRQPHFVLVTAEPLPTRLASIARGTGDVDAVYHVALEELGRAVARVGTSEQQRTLGELVSQRRLLDFNDLAHQLAIT